MPPHQEEEIEGVSSSVSDAPFMTEIRKSQRLTQLPQRYKVKESVHTSAFTEAYPFAGYPFAGHSG
jgi:hypothetical protein